MGDLDNGGREIRPQEKTTSGAGRDELANNLGGVGNWKIPESCGCAMNSGNLDADIRLVGYRKKTR